MITQIRKAVEKRAPIARIHAHTLALLAVCTRQPSNFTSCSQSGLEVNSLSKQEWRVR